MTNHLTVENIMELDRVLTNQFGDGPAGEKDEGTINFIVEKASNRYGRGKSYIPRNALVDKEARDLI